MFWLLSDLWQIETQVSHLGDRSITLLYIQVNTVRHRFGAFAVPTVATETVKRVTGQITECQTTRCQYAICSLWNGAGSASGKLWQSAYRSTH